MCVCARVSASLRDWANLRMYAPVSSSGLLFFNAACWMDALTTCRPTALSKSNGQACLREIIWGARA